MKVAYIRVSSTTQDLEVQRDLVNEYGVDKIFEEKLSGVDQERSKLRECLEFIREGDELVVVRADRISRSAPHLLSTIKKLKDKGVKVRFLKQPELSHENKYADFMLTVLAGVAQLENAIRAERQAEGIARAKAKGVKFGRKAKINGNVKNQVRELRKTLTISEIQGLTGLSRASVYRAL